MAKFEPARIRNAAILGHSHDGKTTLAEALMHVAGAIPRMGSTDAGTATLDFEPEEARRRMSVVLGVGFLEHDGHKINLLDTPGFLDFAGQVESGLAAAEAAVIVVGAGAGLAVGTELAWETCRRERKPHVLVITKMDREHADFFAMVATIREQLRPRPVPIQLPIGQGPDFRGVVDLLHLRAVVAGPDGRGQEVPIPDELKARVLEYRNQMMEAAAESDEELLDRYLEQGELGEAEVIRGLREGILDGSVSPIMCCSATRLLGVRTLLGSIVDLLPPPVPETGPPRALAFATTADQFVGRITCLKVLAGSLRTDQHVLVSRDGAEERLGQLFHPRGREHCNVSEVGAGDIAAVAKLQHTLTGDVIGERPAGTGTPIQFPEPAYAVAVRAAARGDEEKLAIGLHRLADEDPTLRLERNEETHELVLAGLGDVHLEVALEKLERKYGVSGLVQLPRVAHRETVTEAARAEGRHVKQSGGHGQYAVCTVEVSPAARGAGFTFEDRIVGGAIPHNFRPSVEKGIRDTMARGAVAGYPMVDVSVALVDGRFHSVDSSDMAFQLAGAQAFRRAVLAAHPALLEPVDFVSVHLPERCLGDLMGDLNTRRGRITGTQGIDGWQVVEATVPQAELQRFALDLRSITQGRGRFTRRFASYEEMPQHLARPIMDAYNAEHPHHQ